MKAPRGAGVGGGWLDPRSVRLTAIFAFVLLLPLYVLYETRANVAQTEVNLQVSDENRDDHEKVLVVEDHGRKNLTLQDPEDPRGEQDLKSQTSNGTTQGMIEEDPPWREEQEQGGEEEGSLESQTQNHTIPYSETGTRNEGLTAKEDSKDEMESVESRTQNNITNGTSTHEEDRIECDFSDVRTDVCQIRGDVRVHGASSSVLLVSSRDTNSSFKIKPYARKWEGATMDQIRELSLRSTADPGSELQCSVVYDSPAVVFSTGAFKHNYFHEIVDALIPLFTTSHQFGGDVHFLIEDFRPAWIKKYQPVLQRLTRHDMIDLDTDKRVHCFRRAIVGLWSHREMGIDPGKPPYGVSMLDFKALLRESFVLPRQFVFKPENSTGKKPRLLFLSRKESRALINEREVLRMVRRLGYKVIVVGPEQTRNLTVMTGMVNSCDVMLGVHGAGLTNMVFLPDNATLVQIIPWGAMGYPCRFSYGEPAIGMGLRYLDYEINMNETSLINRYPRDHAVFRDPLSIHKQGFSAIWAIFLHQDVTLEVDRFREFLSKSLLG